MPVTGLPATVEKTLTALLCDNAVSSWKVAGEGGNITFVLRLRSVDMNTLSTNMAEPVLNRQTQVQYYRKKAPSQVHRDRERAKKQQQRSDQVGELFDSDENVRAPVCDTVCNQESLTTQSRAREHTMPTHTDSIVATESEENLSMSTVECNTTTIDLQQPDEDTDLQHVVDTSVAGFDAGDVRSYVATLTDRSVQRRLKDPHRNKGFRKSVVYSSDNKSLLICESDDIVVEYSYDPKSEAECMYWFVKQAENNMLTEERVKMANLRKGRHVRKREHSDTQARALRELHTLHGLIQFYLG